MIRTIDDIVRSHLANKGHNTLHGYIRYMKWALDGLKRWHRDGWFEDKLVIKRMDTKKSIAFPDDMVSWVKIGIKVGDRIVEFDHDPTIDISHYCKNKTKENASYNDFYNVTTTDAVRPYWHFTDHFETLGVYYGHDVMHLHNGVGYFKANYACQEFQFSSEVNDSDIILVYKSNGFDPSDETMVNEVAAESLEAWIDYQEKRWTLGEGARETQASKMNYAQLYREAFSQFNTLSFSSIRDLLNRTRYAGRN
jgi:hypothetical protein